MRLIIVAFVVPEADSTSCMIHRIIVATDSRPIRSGLGQRISCAQVVASKFKSIGHYLPYQSGCVEAAPDPELVKADESIGC